MDAKISNDKQSIINPVNYQNNGRTGYVECLKADSIINITITKPGEDQPAGRALLIETRLEGPLILLDICIFNEKDRKQGLADDMMELMTTTFPWIATGHMSKAGFKLCRKHGFVFHKKMFKKDPQILLWDNRDSYKED